MAAVANAQRSGGFPAAVGRRVPRRPTAPAADTPPCGRGKPRPKGGVRLSRRSVRPLSATGGLLNYFGSWKVGSIRRSDDAMAGDP